MRYLKFFIIGFLIIFIIQVGILFFLETKYFTDNPSYTSTKVQNSTAQERAMSNLTLEDGITNISVSYDGRYLSYIKNNNLYTLNLVNGDKNKVSANSGMKAAYYKWVYDRNRLLLIERPVSSINGKFFRLYYYDSDSKNKVEIFNEADNKSVKIPIYNSDEKISSIDMSTLTNTIYVKLSYSNTYDKIYRINIMAQENNVTTVTHNIGKILCTKQDDYLLYENFNDKEVYYHGNKLPMDIEGYKNLSLLGIDNKDNVYFAVTTNHKTKLLYYGKIFNRNWKSIVLHSAVDTNNIIVNLKGQVFIKDSSDSALTELLIGKETSYRGTIIDTYNDGIISKKDNQIIETTFQ